MSQAYYALVIFGLGDTADLTNPYEFYVGDVSLKGPGPALDGVMVGEDFEPLGTKIDPLASSVEIGTQTFRMRADNFEFSALAGFNDDLDVGALWSRRIKEADGLLAADITKSSPTIELFSRDGAGFSAGEVVYLEWEAISLDSVSSTNPTNKTQTFNCTRGVWGTDAREHKTRPGSGTIQPVWQANYDYRVYKKPRMRGRLCKVVEHDGTTLNDVFHGFVTGIDFEDDMTVVAITVEDVFAPLAEREHNKIQVGADPAGVSIGYGPGPLGTIPQPFFQFNIPATAETKLYGRYTNLDNNVILQIGESLAACKYDAAAGAYKAGQEAGVLFPSLLMDTPPPETAYDTDPNSFRAWRISKVGDFLNEVLVFGTVKDAAGNEYGATFDHPGTVKENLHPLTSILHLLASTGRGDNFTGAAAQNYDRLGPTIGAQFPHELIDITGIEALRDEYADDLLQSAIFGWDGKPFKFSDAKEKLAIPWMYYMHPNADGKLTMSKLEVIAPGQANFTTIAANKIEVLSEGQTFGWDQVQTAIAGLYGYPWQKEAQFTQRDLSNPIDPYDPVPKEVERTLKLHGMPVNVRFFQDVLKEFLGWLTKPLPTYHFRLTQPTTRLYAGQRIELDFDAMPVVEYEGAFRDADGNPTLQGKVYGIITEVSKEFGRNVYEVAMWGVNDRLVATPKVIAPSFEVFDYNGTTDVVRVHRNRYGVDLFDWFDGTKDALLELTHWTKSGTERTWNGSRNWAEISGTPTADANYVSITFSDAPSVDPIAGEFFRLVPRNDIEAYNTKYAYMANQFELFSDGDPGDIYV